MSEGPLFHAFIIVPEHVLEIKLKKHLVTGGGIGNAFRAGLAFELQND